jgi:hypothetical protein
VLATPQRTLRGFRPQTTGGAAMRFFGSTTDSAGSLILDDQTGAVLGKSPSVKQFLRQWKRENDVYTPGAGGPRTLSRNRKRRPKVWEAAL